MRTTVGLVVVLLVLAGSAHAGGWNPEGWERAAPAPRLRVTNPVGLPLLWAVAGYRASVSRIDGDRCPSHPTCSAYALQAVRDHGPLLGVALTAGRLLSEADEGRFAPRIRVAGQTRIYAPVERDLVFLGGPPGAP